MASPQEMRLMAKIARLYYEQHQKQSDIAEHLNISQATISRMLKRAEQEKIVRIIVNIPQGFYEDLELAIEQAYGLQEVIVADCNTDTDASIQQAIGSAAAYYLETTLGKQEIIGISSWSSTLLRMVDAMSPLNRKLNTQVVQILGGVGSPAAEAHAAHLTRRLSGLIGGEAVFLPAPGVVGSAEARQVMSSDPFVQPVLELFNHLTVALVGIGAIEPSKLLADSGNIFSQVELEELQQAGAVGDICLRFFTEDGNPIISKLEDRVIGIGLPQLQQTNRTIGVAGGERKIVAIEGAMRGKLVNVLITDRFTAARLVERING